jgi:hypothetical protein
MEQSLMTQRPMPASIDIRHHLGDPPLLGAYLSIIGVEPKLPAE